MGRCKFTKAAYVQTSQRRYMYVISVQHKRELWECLSSKRIPTKYFALLLLWNICRLMCTSTLQNLSQISQTITDKYILDKPNNNRQIYMLNCKIDHQCHCAKSYKCVYKGIICILWKLNQSNDFSFHSHCVVILPADQRCDNIKNKWIKIQQSSGAIVLFERTIRQDRSTREHTVYRIHH